MFDKTVMVAPEDALPGRYAPLLAHPAPHTVLGTDLLAQPTDGREMIYLASGCFWGAEKVAWEAGAYATAVGYMGGYTPNPTYEEVCTGRTGHAETVRVVYDPAQLSLEELLKVFFESHDPTSLNRQGGDIGTQYRSAIFTTTQPQEDTARVMLAGYERVLAEAGLGHIVTQIIPASRAGAFYLAEDYHQQYLHKNPNGYQCHARTGLPCPLPGAGPLGGAGATVNLLGDLDAGGQRNSGVGEASDLGQTAESSAVNLLDGNQQVPSNQQIPTLTARSASEKGENPLSFDFEF